MRGILLLFLGLGILASLAPPPGAEPGRPIVIAHRGASGYRPEHTLEAYSLAIDMGADFIEPDLVPTKDGVLVARHENEISGTTDVESRREFAARRATRTVDGADVTGFFVEDFTLAELKTLRARERLPKLRPANAAYDGRFEVPSLEEIVALAARRGRERGRPVGIYPELKHPTYFAGLGFETGKSLVAILDRSGLRGPEAPVFVQCFEVAPLRALRAHTQLPFVQLVSPTGRPWDFTQGRFARTYADMLTPEGLAEIATYAQGVGPNKDLIVPRLADGRLGTPTTLIRDAHAAGLVVHPWTFRNEDEFLPTDLRGNPAGEYALFLKLGVDGLFSDFPDAAVRARDASQSGASR